MITKSTALFLMLLCTTVFTATMHAENTAALLARLDKANSQTALDDAALKPWHMKVSFQLFDDNQKPGETGTIEQWWLSPNQYKTAYTSPSFTETMITTPTGIYRTTPHLPSPYIYDVMLRAFVHPMPTSEEVNGATPVAISQSIFKVKMDCVMLSKPMQWPNRKGDLDPSTLDRLAPLGLFPSFCFQSKSDLFLLSYDYGNEAAIRNRLGTFQNRSVAVETSISEPGKMLAKAKLETLTTTTITAADLTPNNDYISASTKSEDIRNVTVPAGVLAGRLITAKLPIYPESAKERGISGKVVLRALIGIDGQIHGLHIVSYPDPAMAVSAIAAVRTYKYLPYTLNGQAVEVDTTINVIYNLN